MEKKTVKINFGNWQHWSKDNNQYVRILKKYYNVELTDKPDFLLYSCFGREHLDYHDCVKIFLCGENILPDFNECDYAAAFDYIDFGDRYFRWFLEIPDRSICNRDAVTDSYFDRRFCNFICSNANSGEGTSIRQDFCKKLMEYKRVDCPGKVLHNLDAEDELAPRNGDWVRSKKEFLKKYKFTVAFENSLANGYTTEKLAHPLQSFSIPIYWGNPLVTRDFNPKAFINCNDYDNDFDAVIERVKELDNDPDKYLAMLRENPMQPDFDFDQRQKFEQWLVHIIEKGNKPFNKDPHRHATLYYCRAQLRREKDKLQLENTALKKEAKFLRKKILTAKNKPLVKPFKKVSGNWLYKKVETERYVKTYICGIRVRKRPVNPCTYIDNSLRELEKRLTDTIKKYR